MSYPFASLVPELRPAAEQFLAQCQAAGLLPQVTSARRSHAQQKVLWERYQKGLSQYPAAPPGASAHEYGWAFDMDVQPHDALWDIGPVWESWGGTWGGDKDPVHFELPGASQAALANYNSNLAVGNAPSTTNSLASEFADTLGSFLPGVWEVELAAELLRLGWSNNDFLSRVADTFGSLSSLRAALDAGEIQGVNQLLDALGISH